MPGALKDWEVLEDGTINLVYGADVIVNVCPDSGEIKSVKVDDDSSYDPELKGAPPEVLEAFNVSEGEDAEWPQWEMGL